ncbi:MAG: hypothetical protein IPN38_15210 [Flavobacteriales bacterium]|nr:hypothetical protein [Flavobacteriales bacterium]
MDSPLDPQRSDIDKTARLGKHEIPFVIVSTKSDKLKQPSLVSNIAKFEREPEEDLERPGPSSSSPVPRLIGVVDESLASSMRNADREPVGG